MRSANPRALSRIQGGTISRIGLPLVLLAALLILGSCRSGTPRQQPPEPRTETPPVPDPPAEDPQTGDDQAGSPPADDPGDTPPRTDEPRPRVGQGCGKGIKVTVAETGGVDRPHGLVEGGVPLPRGLIRDSGGVAVCSEGEPIPVRAEPLAYWPDGSLSWIKLTFELPLKAGQEKELTLAPGSSPPPGGDDPHAPPMQLVLTTATGVVRFDVADGLEKEAGDHFFEADVEVLSSSRIRVRTHLAQMRGDAFWKDLSLRITLPGDASSGKSAGAIAKGGWAAAVRLAEERGPVTAKADGQGIVLGLYPGSKLEPYPADQGFHVSHEIILERNADPDDLARRIAAPLRMSLPPDYVRDTRAAGIVCSSDQLAGPFDRSLKASLDLIRGEMKKSGNRGMTRYGDLLADEGTAYMGFYNHEYDPDSALFQYYLHSGDTEALEDAYDMARQFADNSVGMHGGVYQHRSTSYAIVGTVGRAAAEALQSQWRRQPNRPAGDQEMLAGIQTMYNSKRDPKQRVSTLFSKQLKRMDAEGLSDPAARERQAAAVGGYTLAAFAMEEFKQGDKGIIQRVTKADPGIIERNRRKQQPSPRDLAILYRASAGLVPLDDEIPRDVDEIFRPFFQRYGGSWEDFPRFHFYDLPDLDESHHGSHTLVEMLVWGHLMTGDRHLERMALRVARDFAAKGGLADRATERVAEMSASGGMVHIRTGGWTLINLLALLTLTEHSEPELHKALTARTQKLVQVLVQVDPAKYEGVIHAGVVTEGLGRFHFAYAATAPELAAKALERVVQVTTYYVDEQWSAQEARFNYRLDEEDRTLDAGSFLLLFGLAYASSASDDPAVKAKLAPVIESLTASASEPAKTFKAFGMKYRSCYRALGALQGLDIGSRR
ncbi:hypothetical protein KJ682_13610 [bacterium]|nr:hypothetical protein [bacterium]